LSLSLARDSRKPLPERIDAIRDLAVAHSGEALAPLEDLLAQEASAELRGEICRALAAYDAPEIATRVLTGWKSYPAEVRVEAVSLLAGRKDWARELLAAVGRKEVPRTELNDNTILRIRALRDPKLNQQIETVWGRVREQSPAELNLLIERLRTALYQDRGSIASGRKVFEEQCAKCHRFEGQGHDVGPNLDGAARDIDYLLVNVLDPNRVVGQPYYTRFVALKNGRIETGLLAAEDGQSVTLKNENDALKVILKKDIEEMTVQDRSLMPEGLNKNMSVQNFRDLIRYLMANPFLTEVAVAGPFTPGSADGVDLTDPLHSPKVSWSRPVVGPPGKIPLPARKNGKESLAYVAAEVMAPRKLRTRLLLGSISPAHVWLNGKSIYHGTASRGQTTPDQTGIDVQLQEGTNRLLFRIAYWNDREFLYARLLDPQRTLRYRDSQAQSAEPRP
jgi:putative heme-binding domain-containing protein